MRASKHDTQLPQRSPLTGIFTQHRSGECGREALGHFRIGAVEQNCAVLCSPKNSLPQVLNGDRLIVDVRQPITETGGYGINDHARRQQVLEVTECSRKLIEMCAKLSDGFFQVAEGSFVTCW